MSLYEACLDKVSDAIKSNGHKIDPVHFVNTIFAYSVDQEFNKVLAGGHPVAEKMLIDQLVYIASLGLDPSAGKNHVYVKTSSKKLLDDLNKEYWITVPDISESYLGVIKVLIDSKVVNNVRPVHFYKNYPNSWSGNASDEPQVRSHEVSVDERGEYRGCFVVLYLPTDNKDYPIGAPQTSFYHAKDIDATHKKFAKRQGVWNDHYQAMVAKSAIMDAVKYIPASSDIVSMMVSNYSQSHDWDTSTEADQPVYITSEQCEEIYAKLESYKVSKASFLAWLKKELKVNSLETLKSKHFDFVVSRVEAKKPTEKEAA